MVVHLKIDGSDLHLDASVLALILSCNRENDLLVLVIFYEETIATGTVSFRRDIEMYIS
jgi:hypothetical protein